MTVDLILELQRSRHAGIKNVRLLSEQEQGRVTMQREQGFMYIGVLNGHVCSQFVSLVETR